MNKIEILTPEQEAKMHGINDHVYFLIVTDTSTDRVYNLFPNTRDYPEAKLNVYSAKASTFKRKKEQFNLIAES